MKSIAYATTALAFAGALVTSTTAKAEEMQISGTTVGTKVESHLIPAAGDPTRGVAIIKWISTASSDTPGLFKWMHETDVEADELDLKQGQAKVQGTWFNAGNDGTLKGTYAGTAKFTMDEKTNASKGTFEGTTEFTGGTGRFANVRGHGDVKGESSGDSFTAKWTGTITGLEKQAQTQ